MNKKDLKKVIKEMVRESLLEIFAEMKLETIVEQVVKKQGVVKRPVSASSTLREELNSTPRLSKEEVRKKMMENIGVDEDTWANIYEDTATSDNPILGGDDSDKPELVSESALKESGLFRDYSKFVEG